MVPQCLFKSAMHWRSLVIFRKQNLIQEKESNLLQGTLCLRYMSGARHTFRQSVCSAPWKRSSFQDVHKPAVIPTMQNIRYCKGATYSRYIKAYITFELKILLILLPMVCSKDSACVPVCMCVATLGLIAHCKCGCVRLMHNCISNSMRL